MSKWSKSSCYIMGPYPTKKGHIFQQEETSLGKKCIYGMLILSFKKTYKNSRKKQKIEISGTGHKINNRTGLLTSKMSSNFLKNGNI